jgi:aerobic C4-dicarboxylate transport protein
LLRHQPRWRVSSRAARDGLPAHLPAGTIVKKPFYKVLYVQVIVAIIVGVISATSPALATDMKPLGDAFIKLIKMVIGPIIFCTVVTGIAGMEDMKKVGRVGGKALLYLKSCRRSRCCSA